MEKKETLEKIQQAQAGNLEARNELIEENLGLIRFVNSFYGNKEDSFQDGIFGLCKAVQNYKAEKGAKFSTYAFYYIKQAINNYVGKEMYRTSYANIEKIKREELSRTVEISYEKLNLERFLGQGEEQIKEDNACTRVLLEDLLKKSCLSSERNVIEKLFFEGYTEKQIAEELQLSQQRVHALKETALKKMRKVILCI